MIPGENQSTSVRRTLAGVMTVLVVTSLVTALPVAAQSLPVEIGNAAELDAVRNDLGGTYILTNDIDLSDLNNWEPIGDSATPFTGTFDGDGYVIHSLTSEQSDEDSVGLFGVTSSGATVESVTLTNVEVSGSQNVGGLVGFNGGTVANATVSGEIFGTDAVGGLVGFNDVTGTVANSSASNEVSGDNRVGGLVGANDGRVRTSSASGEVSGSQRVGGLVGFNKAMGAVNTSWASGEVSGDVFVGGFVGVNEGSVSGGVSGDVFVGAFVGLSEEMVAESWASGEVSGTDYVGGFVGFNDGGTVANSVASGEVSGADYVGGFVGFNNATGMVVNSLASGEVSGAVNVGGVVGFNTETGTVDNSLASGEVSGDDFVGGTAGSNLGTVTWVVATGEISGDGYVGGIVGDNHGTVSKSFVSSEVSGASAGGLVGRNGGAVTMSYANGHVSGVDVGGLVGTNLGTVHESYAAGPVSGPNAGGLVGLDNGETVSESYWDVEATGQPTSSGGTGLMTTQMTGSEADANMDGFDFTETWMLTDAYPVLRWGATNSVLEVTINVKPGEETNEIPPVTRAKVPVAILGDDGFDPTTTVDVSSLRFGESETVIGGGGATAFDDSVSDVDGDGFTDLVVVFAVAEMGFEAGDTEARLEGETIDGQPFYGTDAVSVQKTPREPGPRTR